VWESKWWCSELVPLERLTCKQPCHISRALTRDTVCKKTSGEDARGLRRNLCCMFIWFHVHVWAHRPSIKGTKLLFIVIKAIIITRKEPTYESRTTQARGLTPLEVKSSSFFSFSIAVSVFSYPLFPMLFAFLFSATTTLSFHSQALSVSFLILFSQCSFLPSFLLPFVLCVWIGGGWCGWGDYSSDQYCRAVGSSVNKMTSVDGPSM